MVPMQLLMLEDEVRNHSKHHQRDTLLDDLQLHKVKGASIIHESDSVSRYLTTVLEEGYHPREGNHQIEGPIIRNTRLLQAQMTIPRKRHKHIAQNEQQNCIYTIHHCLTSFNRLQKYTKKPKVYHFLIVFLFPKSLKVFTHEVFSVPNFGTYIPNFGTYVPGFGTYVPSFGI
jgi:hypothetical protein